MANEHLCVGRQLICLLISVGINALIMASFGLPGDIYGLFSWEDLCAVCCWEPKHAGSYKLLIVALRRYMP